MLLSVEDKNFEDHVLKVAQDKIIAAYLDGIILCRLRNNQLSGYDLLAILQKRFNVLVSPGQYTRTFIPWSDKGLLNVVYRMEKKEYTG